MTDMTTETRRTKTGSKTAKTTATKATKAKVVAPAQMTANIVDTDTRQRMIAEAAYYLAERRGFAPGNELNDWAQAEAQVEMVLRGAQTH